MEDKYVAVFLPVSVAGEIHILLVGKERASGGLKYTMPLGERVLARRSATGARFVAEALPGIHVPEADSSALLADRSMFQLASVPFIGSDGSVQRTAAFLGVRPWAALAGFGRDAYLATHPPGVLDVALVSVCNLLKAVPPNGTSVADFVQSGPPGGLPKVGVVDAAGRLLRVPGALVHLVSHPSVRCALMVAGLTAALGAGAGGAAAAGGGAGAAPGGILPTCTDGAEPLDRVGDLDIHLCVSVPATAPGKRFRLYVSSLRPAVNRAVVASLRVTHIVNCAVVGQGVDNVAAWCPFARDGGIEYALLDSHDMAPPAALPNENPAGQWPAIMALLQEAREEGGNVIIHCFAGVNRSVTTAAVFLVLAGFAPSLEAAVAHVRAIRPRADPMPPYLDFGRDFLAEELALRAAKAAAGAAGAVVPAEGGAGTAAAGAGAMPSHAVIPAPPSAAILPACSDGSEPLGQTLTDMHLCISVPAQGEPAGSKKRFRLYVGSLAPATDLGTLRAAGVTHVVNCCTADIGRSQKQYWAYFHAEGLRYGLLYSQDMIEDEKQQLLQDPAGQWCAIMALMRSAYRDGGNVLVHCWAGKNRSVTTAAVFMALHGFAETAYEAIAHIKAIRPRAGPKDIYVMFGETFVEEQRKKRAALRADPSGAAGGGVGAAAAPAAGGGAAPAPAAEH